MFDLFFGVLVITFIYSCFKFWYMLLLRDEEKPYQELIRKYEARALLKKSKSLEIPPQKFYEPKEEGLSKLLNIQIVATIAEVYMVRWGPTTSNIK
jgi:hypothetical protein